MQRRRIADGLRSLMLHIAAAVGIRAASLYAHFESKEAIFHDYRAQVAQMRLSDQQLEQIVERHSAETVFVEGFKAIRRGVSEPRTERMMRVLFNSRVKCHRRRDIPAEAAVVSAAKGCGVGGFGFSQNKAGS